MSIIYIFCNLLITILKSWFLSGLVLDIIGALLIVKPLIKSRDKFRKLASYKDSGAILGMGVETKVNEDLVKSLETDKWMGIAGAICLVLGFAFQFIGYIIQ